MRILAFLLTAAFALPISAVADPADTKTDNRIDLNLPTEAEIDEMLADMPDFNGLMRDMIKLATDEELQDRMERSGKALSDKIDQSGALETDENGMPDFNKLIRVMMYAMADEEVTGGLLETVDELQTVMEKHLPDEDVD